MKKRIISLLLTTTLLLGGVPSAGAAYENFIEQREYQTFSDVPQDAWYAENVRIAYQLGLIDGKSAEKFEPDKNLTVAETLKLAVCLHSIYTDGETDFESSSPWYRVYIDYALENGILSAEPETAAVDQAATRAQFAAIFANALPEDALEPIGNVEDGAIPDIPEEAEYADAVYLLYRAGVLTGSDKYGRFRPDGNIKRSEAAAIVTRMADPSLRQTVTLHIRRIMSGEEIFRNCMPAVFKIYSYKDDDSMLSMGSGVLLSEDGEAVTCAHVVNGCSSAIAELQNGRRYSVKLYDLDTKTDLARVQLEGGGFPFLETWDQTARGNAVYVLGYPGGGDAKISAGQVFNPENTDFLNSVIETSASAQSGNSGGALVDIRGRLIGIVSSSKESGIPSYAAPITALDSLEHTEAVSFSEYLESHLPAEETCYEDLYPVPDLGKELGVPLYKSTQREGQHAFFYRVADLPRDSERILLEYNQKLNQNTFYQFAGLLYTSSAGYPYSVTLRASVLDGYEILCIYVDELQ